MVNFCSKCGTQLPEGIKFCPKCGTPQSQIPQQQPQQTPQPTQPQQQTMPPPPPPQQPPQQSYQQPQQTYQQPQQNYQQQTYGQTQPYMPKQKKSHTKLIIGLIAIIAVIIIVILLVFFVFGGSDDRFVGKWEQESVWGSSIVWEFESDGDFKLSGTKIGTWEEKKGELCIDYTGSYTDICYEYKFSNNEKTLELSSGGSTMVTLNKK